MKIGINGFGRIGRLVLRLALQRKDLEVVAINDLVTPDNLAYLFRHDTTHGRYKGVVTSDENSITIDGKKILILSERDPLNLPWKKLGVEYVIESSGHFTNEEDAKKHITAGARRVIISAPGKGKIPTFVMGVNADKFNPETDFVVSNASCTTNCVAVISKVLVDAFGIDEALMTTVHAVTAVQPIVDGASKRDWRGGRAASHNVIPASTGAATAVGLCIPELKGKLTGMAFRVPVADVSVVDLTVRLSRSTSYEEICKVMKEESTGKLKGFLGYTDEEVVSSDFIGSTYSAIFDQGAGIALNDRFYKLIAWYDNEMGYAARVVDLAEYMVKREKKL
jgi:glyceraldehyde 3-phosphate dehydrogenase